MYFACISLESSDASQPKFLRSRRLFILDVKPLGSPSLDRICHFEVKIFCFGVHRDNGAIDVMEFIFGGVA
jgi:hypothetical protein